MAASDLRAVEIFINAIELGSIRRAAAMQGISPQYERAHLLRQPTGAARSSPIFYRFDRRAFARFTRLRAGF